MFNLASVVIGTVILKKLFRDARHPFAITIIILELIFSYS